MRILITHCSAKKADKYKQTGMAVTPDMLYTATPTQRFMRQCKSARVPWAIFSDFYGVWFSDVRQQWYEKDPNTVTETEFTALLCDFEGKLNGYPEILFYYNPGRFHRLYRDLLSQTKLADRIKLITHLWEIQ